MAAELDGQVPGEVFDRRDVVERLAQALIEEPLETVSLEGDEAWYFEDLGDLSERAALAFTSLNDGGSGITAHHQAIPPQDVGAANLDTESQNVRIPSQGS